MTAPAAAEVTIIGVDTSIFLKKNHPFIEAQIEAIKQYSTIKLKCNPDSRVGLFRMSGYDYGYLLPPTRDLQLIFRYVEGLLCHCGGTVEFKKAVVRISGFISAFPEFMKRRLLVFVGSPIYLPTTEVRPLGLMLKKNDISLDVVNFSVSEEAFPQIADEYEDHQYAREELAVLVTMVNDNGNSHFVDVVDVDKSSVCDFLSKSILKKNLKYLRRKDERKAKTNVNVKQKLGRNEKNKSASEYGKESPPSELIVTENSHRIDAICKIVYRAVTSSAYQFRMHDQKSGKLKKYDIKRYLERLEENEDAQNTKLPLCVLLNCYR